MQRTYLFVPPEEKSEVQGLGAHWDAESKRWYVDTGETFSRFARWLPAVPHDDDSPHDDEYIIASSHAYVAVASTGCQCCRARIDVICIHCASGTVADEPLAQFTVSDIWAIDDALARQLTAWPTFRRVNGLDADDAYFANHCPHCGAPQDDMYLHSEPDEPFFNIPAATRGSITVTPLAGSIRLSGNEHFEVT